MRYAYRSLEAEAVREWNQKSWWEKYGVAVIITLVPLVGLATFLLWCQSKPVTGPSDLSWWVGLLKA